MNSNMLRLVALVVTAAAAFSAEPPKSGAEVFGQFCTPCHGQDGKGRTPAGRKIGAKDLSASKLTDAEIERQIINGTKDTHGVDRMPSFKEKLTPANVSAVAAYVKTFRP
jgi:mono/diheme cytochrome c family protein